MKKMPNTLDSIKQQILMLKGQEVNLKINRGRRKTNQFRARIEEVYPSVFTVKNLLNLETLYTYSYNDILCGDVKICNEHHSNTNASV